MNRRHLFLVLLGIFSYFLAPHVVFAEEIRNFTARYDIQADGRVKTEEYITYDFGDSYRHGIFRTIPYIKTNEEGKKFVLDFSPFSVSDDKDRNYNFSVSKSDDAVSVKIGDADKTITGVHPYKIEYTLGGALTYFSDHDEFYWNVTGSDWNYTIDRAAALVVLPKDIPASDVKVFCYTGAPGSTDTECKTTYKNGRVEVTANRPLYAGEGLTLAVLFPKNIVAVLEPKVYVPFWETLAGKILIVLIVLAALAWYVIFPLYLPYKWWRHGRDPKPTIGVATAWFAAPKTKKGRGLTPGETGTLVDEHAEMRDITATLINLAQRGYIRILEPKKGEFSLEKVTDSVKGETLLSHESTLLDGIFESANLVNLKTATIVTTVESAKSKLYEQVVTEGFFLKNPQSIRNLYTVVAVAALFTGNFPLLLSALIFGRNMPTKTILGAEQAAIGKSLKNFLTSQERQLSFQAKNQMFFEKLLPFAIAFGVEKIWAERFKNISMKPPEWYSGYSSGRFNSVFFVSSLNSTASSVTRAATPVSSSSGFSSGGGGGFSGGGGGGGGGGSW